MTPEQIEQQMDAESAWIKDVLQKTGYKKLIVANCMTQDGTLGNFVCRLADGLVSFTETRDPLPYAMVDFLPSNGTFSVHPQCSKLSHQRFSNVSTLVLATWALELLTTGAD